MRTRHAFSLIELSIVLVILGLLTGGILSGQSLIRASEIRSVINDQQRYRTAILTFRDKYFALPGDMPTAIKFWGTAGGGTADGADATCAALTTGSTDSKTCNGNGDGSWGLCTYEDWRMWQHLANAGLIEGAYSGVAGTSSSCQAVIGTNSPRSRVSNAGWSAQGNNWAGNDGCDYPHNDNRLMFGAQTTNNITLGAALKPEEAWNIDTKVDDGKPGTGKTLTWATGCNANCATTDISSTAAYNLTYTSPACAMIFLTGTK